MDKFNVEIEIAAQFVNVATGEGMIEATLESEEQKFFTKWQRISR